MTITIGAPGRLAASATLVAALGCGAPSATAPAPRVDPAFAAEEPQTGASGAVAEPQAGAVVEPLEVGPDPGPTPAPTVAASAVPAPEPLILPALTAGDPHARVLAQLPSGCSALAVEGGAVYVQSGGSASALFRVPVGGGEPEVVHQAESYGDYRVASGSAVWMEHTEANGIRSAHLVSLTGAPPRLLAAQIRVSSWALAAEGVYFGDPTYTEPRIGHVPLAGGEPNVAQTFRPVLNEDRIEQLVASGGELFFVAVRTQLDEGSGYSCHELRGGPASRSRTLRRARQCPDDDELLRALTASPRHLYYYRDHALHRISRRGGREETVWNDVSGLPETAASDDQWLLWSESAGLVRVRLQTGAVPELVGERAWVLSGPVIADGIVYWTRREPRSPCVVMARALDAPALAPYR